MPGELKCATLQLEAFGPSRGYVVDDVALPD